MRAVIPVLLACVAGSLWLSPRASSKPGIHIADFNSDGYADLAVGVPGEDVGSKTDAGGVNVIYGGSPRLVTSGNKFWTQDTPGIVGVAEPGDKFGFALAARDFNLDGIDDLAIGAPGEDIGTKSDAGGINILFGSSSGLHATGNQFFSQDTAGVEGTAEPHDQFGFALVGGAFNDDLAWDLAVGVPGEGIGTKLNAGVVQVFHGGPSSGLRVSDDQVWHQDRAGIVGTAEAGDRFGQAVATGDLDASRSVGFDDLAVGAPGEDVGTVADAGSVNVIYSANAGLTATRNQQVYQGLNGIDDTPEPNDRFGEAVAMGDFDLRPDYCDDLAVGVPGEDIALIDGAGAVNLVYSHYGLQTTDPPDVFLTQGPTGLGDLPEPGDAFGSDLAVGWFNDDSQQISDLVIGVPNEDVGMAADAGAIHVLYGSNPNSTGPDPQFWTEDSTGLGSTADAGDHFGSSLSVFLLGGISETHLAVGIPGEKVSSQANAGAVLVLYGTASGLSATGSQVFNQDTPEIEGTAEAQDNFGAA